MLSQNINKISTETGQLGETTTAISIEKTKISEPNDFTAITYIRLG